MTSAAPEARIRLFMDALIAEYNALCARWQLLQVAGLGIAVLAVFGVAAGELEAGRSAAIVATGVASIAWAGRVLERERIHFERRVIRLADQLERMMTEAGPS